MPKVRSGIKISQLCSECKRFLDKLKPMTKEIPNFATITMHECKACKMSYEVYKGTVMGTLMSLDEDNPKLSEE